MIDPVLKKFGLSEARRSVKKLNNCSPFSRTPKKTPTPKTSQKKLFNQTQQIPMTPRDNKTTVLQKLISYLRSNYNKICPNHANTTNRIKFLCLNEPCSQNLGCAECFLYRHSDHTKVQIGTSIRQLEQLDYFLKDSYDSIMSQKSVIKTQFINQIDLQINHMCDQFHRNLQFLKNKALKEIDNHLFTKYEQLQILNNLRNSQRQNVSQHLLIGQLMRIDIQGIERSLNTQLRQLSYERLNLQPIVKFFQQMNGALGYFMAEFKKCFPKIYAFQQQTLSSDSKFLTKDELRFRTISEFKSSQNEHERPETEP